MPERPYRCPLCGADATIDRPRRALPLVVGHTRPDGAPCPASGGTRRRARVLAAHVRECPTGDRATCLRCADLGLRPVTGPCPDCGGVYELRYDRLPEHAGQWGERCPASGRPPATTCPDCGARMVPCRDGALDEHGCTAHPVPQK